MLTKTWIFFLNLSLIFAEEAEPDKAALSELITRLEPTKAEPKSTISITKTPENNASCNWGVSDSGIKLGSDRAYKSLEIKCCDSELEENVKESIKLGMNTPKLGDAVKFIQRRAQLSLQLPFEVIVSKKNFAIASYYHGSKACKISDGKYFYLIYETPVFYDQFNIKQEEWLASLDSQEPLGSTKTANIRGDLLDINEFPLAGDDLSVQPSKDSIINQGKAQPGKILDNSIKIQVNDVDVDAITTLDQLMGANGTVSERFRRAGELVSDHSFNEFGTLEILYDSSRPVENSEEDVGPMPEDRKSDSNWRKQERLPKGTHCNHRMKGGNKCCDGPLSRTIRDALMDLGTSPQFGNPNQEGIIAGRIQKIAQARFDRSFEVIVSQSDFAIASHMVGYNNCKQKFKGYTILTYATPRQYDVEHQAAEDYFFGVSAQEPKGSTDISLPGQKPFHTPLKLEAEGQRQGFPVGSQCGADELQAGQTYAGQGSSCCNRDIFNAANQAYDRYINERNFNQYDLRNLARAIQWEVENVMSHSMEVIVSRNDFVFHVHPENMINVCKYRVDKYFILAYGHEINYPLHSTYEIDLGRAKPFNCPSHLTGLHGLACCDPAMNYQLVRSIEDAKRLPDYNRHDAERIATEIQRRMQRRYNTTFETIVSPADFVWGTARFNQHACKVDMHPFNALAFQSSTLQPPIEDFIDPIGTIPNAPLVPINAPLVPAPIFEAGPPVPNFVPVQPAVVQAPPQPVIQQFIQVPPQPVQAPPQLVQAPPQLVQAPPQLVQAPPQFQFAQVVQAPPIQAPPVYYPPVVPAAASCFSYDTWLTTPAGKKRMDELKIGDFVLTANKTKTYFAPITTWLHREPEVNGSFITLMTEYGKMLRITPRHLIYRNKCQGNYEEYVKRIPQDKVYAEELQIGDCIMLIYKGQFRQQKIRDIWISERKGIYAPMTGNGRIFVNDILASCYSDLKEIGIQHKFAQLADNVRKAFNSLAGSEGFQNLVSLPLGVDILLDMAKLVTPSISL